MQQLHNLFPPGSPLSQLSSTDALAQLLAFQNSAAFRHYSGRLQADADAAINKVCAPLDSDDPYAREHREQLIGASVAFLKLFQLIQSDTTSLQEIVKNQANES